MLNNKQTLFNVRSNFGGRRSKSHFSHSNQPSKLLNRTFLNQKPVFRRRLRRLTQSSWIRAVYSRPRCLKPQEAKGVSPVIIDGRLIAISPPPPSFAKFRGSISQERFFEIVSKFSGWNALYGAMGTPLSASVKNRRPFHLKFTKHGADLICNRG